jgi:hypothetical protein
MKQIITNIRAHRSDTVHFTYADKGPWDGSTLCGRRFRRHWFTHFPFDISPAFRRCKKCEAFAKQLKYELEESLKVR